LQFFRCIFNNVSKIKKSALLSVLISVEGTGKNQLESGQENMGDSTVLSLFLLRNHWPKPTGELERCREVETNCWFSIFWVVSS